MILEDIDLGLDIGKVPVAIHIPERDGNEEEERQQQSWKEWIQSILSQIPERTWNIVQHTPLPFLHNDSTSFPNQNQCQICLDDYVDGDEVCYSKDAKCQHSFHADCMISWLLENDHCPICRRNYVPPDHSFNLFSFMQR